MNTDFYCEIGDSHILCEDYAIAGEINDKIAYAIVSDGCSASPDVDVGARILAHTAKDFLFSCYQNSAELDIVKENNVPMYHRSHLETLRNLRTYVAAVARSTARMLKLNVNALDATLLVCVSDGNITYVLGYGDGGSIIKFKNGSIQYRYTEFESGAPYYLSYVLDSQRALAYKEQYGDTLACYVNEYVSHPTSPLPGTERFRYIPFCGTDMYSHSSYALIDIEWIVLTSDGIRTYRKHEEDGGVTDILPVSIAHEFTLFKNFNGSFMQRRMQAMQRENKKRNIGHYDDVSVAVIAMP